MAITYQLITPDGTTFNFSGTGYDIIPNIPDGMGFPPVQYTAKPVYQRPGAILQDINISPRIVTITAALYASSQETLHAARAALMGALRWNRDDGNPPAPSKLRYSANGHSADLYVYYMGDVLGAVGKSNNMQLMGIRLIAYDPLWYATTATPTSITPLYNTLAVERIIGKVNNAWTNLGITSCNGSVYALAVSNDGNTLYIGGTFTDLNAIPNADRIAAYDIAAGTWTALGTGINDGVVYAIAVAPDGRLYATGSFTLAGGGLVNRIAVWDGVVWNSLGALDNNSGYALAISKTGIIYVGGTFTTIGGAPIPYIAQWNGVVWAAMGATIDSDVLGLESAPNGNLYAVGNFTTPSAGFAYWNGTAWIAAAALPTTGVAVEVSTKGDVFIGGDYIFPGNYNVSAWNGFVKTLLGTGADAGVYALATDSSDLLYAGGAFATIGGVATADRIAAWNGSAWEQLDIDLPGAPIIYSLVTRGEDLFIGFSTAGSAVTSSSSNITNAGSYDTYPVFAVTGPGTLSWIENATTGKKMIFNCYLNAGETATITPEDSTITSDWRGDLLPYAVLLPQSDFGNFVLAPAPIAPAGVNSVAVMMTGTTPVVQNDTSGPASAAQLDDWEDMTGVDCDNTATGGRIYVSIIDDTGGFFHVALYDDYARTHLVGHTATYNAATDPLAIVADNASGLGGHIEAISATAADANIVVFFATCCESHYDAFLTVDEAVD